MKSYFSPDLNNVVKADTKEQAVRTFALWFNLLWKPEHAKRVVAIPRRFYTGTKSGSRRMRAWAKQKRKEAQS